VEAVLFALLPKLLGLQALLLWPLVGPLLAGSLCWGPWKGGGPGGSEGTKACPKIVSSLP
jgi:hypothetical protein